MKVDRVINQATWEHQANTKGFPNNEYLNDLEKIRKALEIIKNKKVDVQLLKDSKNVNEYNWCVHTKDRALTKEENDLLMEILL